VSEVPSSSPSPPAQPVVVPRWVQLVALTLGLLALYALARAAHTVLLVFLVATVIALILSPLVKRVQHPLGAERVRLPRGIAVLGVYLGFFLVVAGAGVLLANPITNQVRTLQREDEVFVRKRDPEHGAGKNRHDRSFQLDRFF